MAGPYRAIPTGNDKLAGILKGIKANLSSQQTAAPVRNSKITGGAGLTVEDTNGQAIQLLVTPDDVSAINFSPPTIDQSDDWVASLTFAPNPSLAGGGSLFMSSPTTPVFGNPTPAQVAEIDINSGDGASQPASVNLQAGQIGGVQLNLLAAFAGNPASIRMGQPGTFSGIQEDGSSWRLLGPSSSLILPNGTSEVRVRDAGNTAYTVIRASAFTVTSTREAKQDIRDLGWSAADVVRRAKAMRWRYRPEHADPDRVHFGPMAEDLPAELVDNTDPDVPGVNAMDLIGVLWAAVGEREATIADLERRLSILEQRLNTQE